MTLTPWARFQTAVTAAGGQLFSIPADRSLRLYDSPSDPRRATMLAPPEALVLERRPPSYVAFVEEHGYLLVSLPGRKRSFAFAPPRAAAQLTSATGEYNRPWDDVAAERAAGRGTFAWMIFAAWDLSEVHGWAFGPDHQVWLVEEGGPVMPLGTFEEWIAATIQVLEQTAATRKQEQEVRDHYDEEEVMSEEDAPAPTSLDEL
jgi:hypothetical protein